MNGFIYQTSYFIFTAGDRKDQIQDQLEMRLNELMLAVVKKIVRDGPQFPVKITLQPITEHWDFKIVAKVEKIE